MLLRWNFTYIFRVMTGYVKAPNSERNTDCALLCRFLTPILPIATYADSLDPDKTPSSRLIRTKAVWRSDNIFTKYEWFWSTLKYSRHFLDRIRVKLKMFCLHFENMGTLLIHVLNSPPTYTSTGLYTSGHQFVHCWSWVCTLLVTSLYFAGHEFVHLWGSRVCTLMVTSLYT